MSKPDFSSEVEFLLNGVTNFLKADGVDICTKFHNKIEPILEWNDYIVASELTGTCDEYALALKSSFVETAACLSLGMVRQAMFSQRSQIDIMLSWIYFKDHPIEWNRLEYLGKGFISRQFVIDYLNENVLKFNSRFINLNSKKTRAHDPYQIISAHIHNQSTLTLGSASSLAHVIGNRNLIEEVLQMQEYVCEFMEDILVSIFAQKWASLPSRRLSALRTRLGPEKAAAVFS